MPLISFSSFSKRRSSLLLALLVVASLLLFAYHLPLLPVYKYPQSSAIISATKEGKIPAIPASYTTTPNQIPFCEDRFGTKYLDNLRDSATQYCNESSALTCFHSQTLDRWDSFCFGKEARFEPGDGKFHLGCDLTGAKKTETTKGFPNPNEFHKYWYDTGPGRVLDGWIKMEHEAGFLSQKAQNYTILVKREGATNVWHCLMEIYSMMLSLDVLQMTPQPDLISSPFISERDAMNTQLIILDDHEDGPYYELWSVFAKKQVLRLKDISQNTTFENIIVPLAGGSNPLWQGDWEINECESSTLLNTFANRVLEFYDIQNTKQRQSDKITLTFINRVGSRKLLGQEKYLAQLRNDFPLVNIQSIDFAAIPFKEQLKIVQDTDILAGVHGAGLTHGIFLPPGSAMVEILPNSLNHKGFRNVASLRGHSYFSTHASKISDKHNWQSEDVSIEIEKFMGVMDVAIKTMYNKGLRNYDVI